VLATVWLVIVIAPIYYMVLASFRSQGNYLTENPWVPSGGLTVSEYGTAFGAGLGRYLVNSVIITAVCVTLTLSLCLAAAFRIVRRSTRAAAASFRILLIGLAIPLQAIIVPLYLLVYKAHLYDTLFALMITMSAAAVPLTVLVMVSFVRDIPRELIGAMVVDGGTEWTVFRRLQPGVGGHALRSARGFSGRTGWVPAPATVPADRSSVLVVMATKTDERSGSRCGGGAPVSVARLHAWQMRTW